MMLKSMVLNLVDYEFWSIMCLHFILFPRWLNYSFDRWSLGIILIKTLRNFYLYGVYVVMLVVQLFAVVLVSSPSLWKCYLIVYDHITKIPKNSIKFQNLPACNSPYSTTLNKVLPSASPNYMAGTPEPPNSHSSSWPLSHADWCPSLTSARPCPHVWPSLAVGTSVPLTDLALPPCSEADPMMVRSLPWWQCYHAGLLTLPPQVPGKHTGLNT